MQVTQCKNMLAYCLGEIMLWKALNMVAYCIQQSYQPRLQLLESSGLNPPVPGQTSAHFWSSHLCSQCFHQGWRWVRVVQGRAGWMHCTASVLGFSTASSCPMVYAGQHAECQGDGYRHLPQQEEQAELFPGLCYSWQAVPCSWDNKQ